MDFIIFIIGTVLGAIILYFVLVPKLQQENAKLQAILTEREKNDESLKSSKAQMNDDFQKIARMVLKQDSLNLSEKNADLLTPLKTQIENFRTKIESLSTEQVKDRSALKEQIRALTDAHKTTLAGAEKLTNALTYDNKQQGDWGEMVLETILQSSGLQKNREYELQKKYQNEEGKHFKPDVIVHLPEGKDIVIDSKVSLVSYQNYLESGDKNDLRAHIISVEKHIRDISLKGYENLHNINTLDYIFVFFPIEASLLIVLEQRPNLFTDAIKKNVALVSPSTLVMSLKLIHHIWQSEKQNKNTDEIVRLSAAMYDKLAGFVDSLDNINTHLEKAVQSYAAAKNRLRDGKGNIFNIADKIKQLGVPSKKQLKQ